MALEPLRFVPKDKIVVLGLVSTKVPKLETADELKRKIDEAGRFIALEQLALSPQCGFSSNIVGNVITEEDQWRKLELAQNVAAQVWGSLARRSLSDSLEGCLEIAGIVKHPRLIEERFLAELTLSFAEGLEKTTCPHLEPFARAQDKLRKKPFRSR